MKRRIQVHVQRSARGLAIPGAIGALIADRTGAGNWLRAFLISSWGAVFLVGAGFFMFFDAVIVGGACIE